MIGFYVIMIAVLTLAGAVGYTILSTVQTTNALSLAERNASRLELTANALRQVIVADAEGRLIVPMGVPSVSGDPISRTALPDWVSGESATPWGVRYGYCPYALNAGSGDPATVYGGATYPVSVTSGSSDPVVYGAARDYVVSGTRAANALDVGTPPRVLAFLISPSNNGEAVPACESVYWDGRAWLVSGAVTGSVRAITADAMADTLSQAPRQLRRHVRQGSTGDGLTSGSPAGLEAVLREWAALKPHRLTVVLQDDGGDLLVDPTAIDLGAGPGALSPAPAAFGRHLVLEAAPGDSPRLAGTGVLRVPSDLTVDGVDFGPGLGLAAMSGTRILIRDAALSAVETGGGEVVLGSGVTVTSPAGAAAPPVRVTGGGLSIEGAVTIDASAPGGAAIRQRGGRVHVDASLVVTTSASAPVFEEGGYGDVSGSDAGSLTLNGSGALSDYIFPMNDPNPCTGNFSTCAATCEEPGRSLVSGSCSANALGGVIIGSSFVCNWAAPVTNPTATAICAPKR